MVEQIESMPPGTIGFRATGKLTREDYLERLIPAIRDAAEAGEVRMLYALGPGFEGMEAGAMLEDAKTGFEALRHHAAWKRSAIVTDAGWIRDGMHLFGWMVPGEAKVFDLDQIEDAKEWLAS